MILEKKVFDFLFSNTFRFYELNPYHRITTRNFIAIGGSIAKSEFVT